MSHGLRDPSELTLSDCWDVIFAIERIDGASTLQDVRTIQDWQFVVSNYLKYEYGSTADARAAFVHALVHAMPNCDAEAVFDIVDTLMDYEQSLALLAPVAAQWLRSPPEAVRSFRRFPRNDHGLEELEEEDEATEIVEGLVVEYAKEIARRALEGGLTDDRLLGELRRALAVAPSST